MASRLITQHLSTSLSWLYWAAVSRGGLVMIQHTLVDIWCVSATDCSLGRTSLRSTPDCRLQPWEEDWTWTCRSDGWSRQYTGTWSPHHQACPSSYQSSALLWVSSPWWCSSWWGVSLVKRGLAQLRYWKILEVGFDGGF